MPNWCSNKITIKGSEDALLKIKTILDSLHPTESSVFRELIGLPIPDEEYDKNWYATNINHFGTKWDVSLNDCSPSFYDDEIELYPDTAWNPPIEFGCNLAVKYGVTVEMYYHECGVDFCGKAICHPDGNFESEEYGYMEGLYHFDEEQFYNELEYQASVCAEDNISVEEFIDMYPFADTDTLEKIYLGYLKI